MNNREVDITCDLMIIGTGMAGMAAALFAAERNIKTVQAGQAGQLGFASGLIDVLGVHPASGAQIVDNPWQGISRLRREQPDHPYARMEIPEIQTAVQAVLTFLEKSGYPHISHVEKNMHMITPAGTIKPTYALPHTMAKGPAARAEQKPCLLVDFKGFKGFSGRQITESLADSWPGLRPVRIGFPGTSGELYTERMARALEAPANRRKLVDAVLPLLGDAQIVAFPAVLGISRTLEVTDDLEAGLGVPVFEIPTMLPAATGLRLREKFEHQLRAMGIQPFFQHAVSDVAASADRGWIFTVENQAGCRRIAARAAILCSGRFFGQGLHADRGGIRETIFDLPVVQPTGRAAWHHKDLLHPEGHPVNQAGLAVDDSFRPVDNQGRAIRNDLFTAGSILAHQDWMRQKCGSGLAIATAYRAVNACRDFLALGQTPYL
ncbi:MAG: glycerol-3-phosphate dehydrogenase subunit GlpB [Desulfobacteraceae bacterium]|nr:glycerol-3-phosphate dehydrogenase subunit GlpB [Desulfobacteraceae bacterium]